MSHLSRQLLVPFFILTLSCAKETPIVPGEPPPATEPPSEAKAGSTDVAAGEDSSHSHGDVLRIVARQLPPNPVILEGGAFDGTDTVRMAKQWPGATIYSFEPVPGLCHKVREATAGFANVSVFELALSDKVGTAVFHVSEFASAPGEPGQSGSLLVPKDHTKVWPTIEFKKDITVKTTTIDAWAQEHNVKAIDFIWLDIQGVELDVLKASPRMLETVKVIHMEVEFVELYAGQALFDETKAWLSSQGFTPIAADFDPGAGTSKLVMGNVIFVRK